MAPPTLCKHEAQLHLLTGQLPFSFLVAKWHGPERGREHCRHCSSARPRSVLIISVKSLDPEGVGDEMNHQEEQAGEMEALISIYENELEVVESSPYHVFTMPVKSEAYDPDDPESEEGLFVLLKFTYTPKYPEEGPLMEVEESQNMDEDVLREFLDFLATQAEENLGMVMIFTIISAAIEWLGSKCEQMKTEKEENAKRKKEMDEEVERKRFEGTKVTIENFIIWKKSFDEDKARERKLKAGEKEALFKGKLSGKQLFMRDSSLIDSDIKFLEAAGETIKVDESLFEDLDDLDLEDDDDPDWNPRDLGD